MTRKDGSYLNSGTIFRFIFALILFALYFIATAVFRANPALCGQYSEMTRAVFLLMSGALSYVKFAVAELLLYLILVLAVFYTAVMIYKIITAGHAWARIARMISNAAALYAVLLVLFFALYGPAYSQPPLAERLGVETQGVSTTDIHKLQTLTELMRDRANTYADLVPRDISGNCEFGSFDTLSALTARSFESAELKYSILSGPYAPVKAPTNKSLLSTLGLTGIFVPYTAEAVVNDQAPAVSLVFTMAHEMSHRLSIAPEDEANFLAFLVCRESSDRRANYSGYFMAYRYCINALSAVNSAAAGEINAGVGENLSRDLAQYKEFSLSCDGLISSISEKVNDSYLKSQGQASGTASYGALVDLLLAEYADVL